MDQYTCKLTMIDGKNAFVIFMKSTLSWVSMVIITYSQQDASLIESDDIDTVIQLLSISATNRSIKTIEFTKSGGIA